MDNVKEKIKSVLKELKIESEKVVYAEDEFKNARNPHEPRKNLINMFLWDEHAIKFMQFFIEKLRPEEIAVARKERSGKDYFVNEEYKRVIKSLQAASELKKLYADNQDYVFGIRLKIKGNYYSFTTTGHENELEFNSELVELAK